MKPDIMSIFGAFPAIESFSTLSLPQRREVPDKAAKAGARARKARRKAAKVARRRNR